MNIREFKPGQILIRTEPIQHPYFDRSYTSTPLRFLGVEDGRIFFQYIEGAPYTLAGFKHNLKFEIWQDGWALYEEETTDKLDRLEKAVERISDVVDKLRGTNSSKSEPNQHFKVGDWLVFVEKGANDSRHPKQVIVGDIGTCFRISSFDTDSDNLYQVAISEEGIVARIEGYPKDFRKATTEEIKEHLTKEAEKRGIAPGARVRSVWDGNVYTITSSPMRYYEDLTDEFSANIVIYLKGKWSEVITKAIDRPKPVYVGTYKADLGKHTLTVGCKTYPVTAVQTLYVLMSTYDIESISVEGHVVSVHTLEQILDSNK